MGKQFINPEPSTYSSAAVEAQNIIFVGGQIPLDANGRIVGKSVETQAVQCFENLKAVLEASGADLEDVVRLNIYAVIKKKDFQKEYQKIREVRSRYFKKHFPAATGVIVEHLATKGVLVEIEAIAVKG